MYIGVVLGVGIHGVSGYTPIWLWVMALTGRVEDGLFGAFGFGPFGSFDQPRVSRCGVHPIMYHIPYGLLANIRRFGGIFIHQTSGGGPGALGIYRIGGLPAGPSDSSGF